MFPFVVITVFIILMVAFVFFGICRGRRRRQDKLCGAGTECEREADEEKTEPFSDISHEPGEPAGEYEASLKEEPKKKRKEKAGFTAPGARILAVDDNPMNLVVIRTLIQPIGSMLDTADSGIEALKLCEQEKYDIIFLDHLMPAMDGIDTLRKIRRNDRNPNHDTPVVCLTANAVSASKEKYLEAGFDDHLAKPVNSAKMESMILKHLPADKVILNTDQEEDVQTV